MRDGKNDMVMLYRQCLSLQLLNPFYLLVQLAFRAMPVAATVVAVPGSAAIVANFFMPAQRSRAAPDDIQQCFCLLWGDRLFFNQLAPELFYNTGKLILCPTHGYKECRADYVALSIRIGQRAGKSWWW